ncbi:MAG: glycerol kinase GlpK [Candidatus Margulisiibacteriota bacterium]
MTYIIAIDSGTTSTRVIAYDPFGNVAHIAQKTLDIRFPQPGWVEQEALEIWEKTHQCLVDTLTVLGPNTIEAIGITNQRETSIIWDKKTHLPIGPAINWQCRRTQGRCQELNSNQSIIKQLTGLPLDPYFSATKFEWLLNNFSEARALNSAGKLCFGTVDVWLLFQLTNGKSYFTDVTNASRTMLFDIHDQVYHQELCKLVNIHPDQLPQVKNSIDSFGVFEFDGIEIPIKAMIGDQQAALFAQCNETTGRIKNTYGTGLFLMANTGQKAIQTHDLITTIALGKANQISYAIEGSVFTGGSLIQWLRDNLGLLDHAHQSEVMATSVSNNAGVTIIPALTGLGAPHWKPNAKGMILGLTRKATKAHIVRAALEAIVMQSHDIIQLIQKECAHILFNELWVDGGASSNNWLMQLQADVSGLTVARPNHIEATALGAAYCAGLDSSFFKLDPTKNHKTFDPQTDPVELKDQWKNALRQMN